MALEQKEIQKRYSKTKKFKDSQKRYEGTDKGKKVKKKYIKSEKGMQAQLRYYFSEKGLKTRDLAKRKRKLFSDCAKFLADNPKMKPRDFFVTLSPEDQMVFVSKKEEK
jgi:alpha-galactosidase/6-phospho-beta-glucosidase family protein